MKTKFILIILSIIIFNAQLTAQGQTVSIPFHQGASLLTEEKAAFKDGDKKLFKSPPSFQLTEQSSTLEKKSIGKALLLSLVLPGAGEYYMGRRGHAKFFFSMELIAWTGVLANSLYVNHLEDEYYTYAVQHADLRGLDKDDQFWINIGKYNDIYSFNEQRCRERYYDEVYEINQQNYWMWDSKENRYTYDGKRIRAAEIANQDVYFYTAILLNHLISGINAMRLARKHNRQFKAASAWNIQFDSRRLTGSTQYYGLRFAARF